VVSAGPQEQERNESSGDFLERQRHESEAVELEQRKRHIARGSAGAMKILPAVLVLGFVYGCAATARSPSTARAAEPDCSFRAATSCWTVAGRYPPRRAEPTDSQPDEILKQSPAVLASRTDSALGSR
jgi:hypothetical protein